jgi:hypothetical protein
LRGHEDLSVATVGGCCSARRIAQLRLDPITRELPLKLSGVTLQMVIDRKKRGEKERRVNDGVTEEKADSCSKVGAIVARAAIEPMLGRFQP